VPKSAPPPPIICADYYQFRGDKRREMLCAVVYLGVVCYKEEVVFVEKVGEAENTIAPKLGDNDFLAASASRKLLMWDLAADLCRKKPFPASLYGVKYTANNNKIVENLSQDTDF